MNVFLSSRCVRGVRLVAVCVATLFAVPLRGQTTGAPVDTSLAAVLRAAASYVDDYQKQLTQLMAEETFKQSGGFGPARRELKSDVLFMFVPGDSVWIAVRDVRSVDGKTVDDFQDFVKLLKDTTVVGLAKQLRDHNARYNLGTSVKLNFNEPTLGLQILETKQQARFDFSEGAIDISGDATIVNVTFIERRSPTLISLIQNGKETDIFTSGEFSIEAGTGRVRHAQIAFDTGAVATKLATTYALDQHLHLWVPHTFEDWYRGGLEDVTGQATYSNYRKVSIETSEVIK